MGRRQERVAEQIHRTISDLLTYQTQDPRLAGVTVSGAEITGDLRRATVYILPKNSPAETTEALRGLEHAQGYLRHELAERLQLRFAPELSFAMDERHAQAEHWQQLIDQLAGGKTGNG
jgi:ribosome-binding factor A